MMSESSYKNEFLFVLGNGASIASARSELKQILKCVPAINNFGALLREINEVSERSEVPNWLELSTLMDENHLDILLKDYAQKIIEMSVEKGTGDVVKLLEQLIVEKNCVGKEIEKDQGEKINMSLVSESLRISNKIDTLVGAIFSMVGSYYSKIDDTFFCKLWQLVQQTKSPVISLNWDINFERTIYEKTKVDMQHYYGECAFGQLFPDQKKAPFNPIINILKPHGSLNWYFIDLQGMQGRILGKLEESEYCLVISNHILDGPHADYDLRYLAFLIPPLPEKEIPLINENSPHCSLDCFWERKKAMKDDIFTRIKEYATSTRTLVIIGYSFPDGDGHIKELFKSNQFEKVLVFDTDEKVFQRIKGYFPKAKYELKKGGFADILEWDVGEISQPSRQ